MKRRDLLSAIEEAGFVFLRDQGGHTVYRCPCGKHRAAVPRHREVKSAHRAEHQQTQCMPKGWLQ